MHLHEEYIHRHKLDVPIIRYDQRSKFFLRNDDPKKWRIISFEWQMDYGHPSYWMFNLTEPIHASFGRERNWRELFYPRQVFWEEYESFIKNLVHNYSDWKVVENQMDYELFCWEVLLYTCDNWFSQNMRENRSFLKNLSWSIDKKLSLDARWESYKEAYYLVQDTSLSVSEFFSCIICNHYSDGSQWFSELINNESKKISTIAS